MVDCFFFCCFFYKTIEISPNHLNCPVDCQKKLENCFIVIKFKIKYFNKLLHVYFAVNVCLLEHLIYS